MPQFQKPSFREHLALIVGGGVSERGAEAEAAGDVVKLSTLITQPASDTES